MVTNLQAYSNSTLDGTLIRKDEAHLYNDFVDDAILQDDSNLSAILSSIPNAVSESFGPLATLSALMTALPGPWPILEVQQAYTKAWKTLPEEAKSGHGCPAAQQLLDTVLRQCKHTYSSLLDLLPASGGNIAIIDPESGQSLHHDEVTTIIKKFNLHVSAKPGDSKPVVAISLPNGPLLALTILATATYYKAAPLSHGSGVGAEQFRSDVLQSTSDFILALPSDVERLGLLDDWISAAGIQVLLAEFGADMSLVVKDLAGSRLENNARSIQPTPNQADDTGIMLFTSGTSGTKKLVPLSIHSMVCGVAMVVQSWGLSPSMRCLNQMPLNHVGGLIRNLFAPIMSGGSVISCSGFDANLFWDCVEDFAPTWYYASPTMHQCILEAGVDRREAIARSQFRLVCNAAGGLLPSLAHRLRDTFSHVGSACIVLPSYGMTECMPISTPPLDYQLDKTGTSGISVGPEITILDGNDVPVGSGVVGRISVRGAPVFDGYLQANNTLDKSCFTNAGFFDTGDMGYLDQQSYLYITGRSKEVINRGGELISPFEVEEAVVAASGSPGSPTFGKISKALAFSVTHDVLQEVIGIAIVTTPGYKRASLDQIQQSVQSTLGQVKIPTLLVYMDHGLPVNNNKVLRIKLAARLRLPEISDSTPKTQLHYEAICPPPNTPLSVAVQCETLVLDHSRLEQACRRIIPSGLEFHIDSPDFYPQVFIAPTIGTNHVKSLEKFNPEALPLRMAEVLHGYELPSKVHYLEHPLLRDQAGNVDGLALMLPSEPQVHSTTQGITASFQSAEDTVKAIFSQVLSRPLNEFSGHSDFFDLGGDSMKAGRLLSLLRKEFQLRLPINMLFTNRCVSELAALIDEKLRHSSSLPEQKPVNDPSDREELMPGCEETHSSTRPVLLFIQLVPLLVFYPLRRALTWTLFMYCLAFTQRLITNQNIPGRLLNLVVSLGLARYIVQTISPMVAIAFKWLVIGKYKEGLYPMWGRYHTRWWLVQKVIAIAGMGSFRYSNWSRILYYRCLGAKFGKNVAIDQGATLGEYDLLDLKDGVVLERCIVRPFAAERNASMYLGRISIGSNSTIGLASIVAPGADLPSNTCIGPNSSSWETFYAEDANRDLCASKARRGHWLLHLLIGLPIRIFCAFIGAVPWLGCLVALVNHEPKAGASDELRMIIMWFASPERVGYHYLAMAANASLGPAFFFACVYGIKKVFDLTCGELESTAGRKTSQLTLFRRQLMRTLMPAPQLHKLTELFGTHYEATSILMRSLGATIGKRIYWPGTGPSIQDFDLINVGDDVVFGSRSHLVTTDGNSSDNIKIGNGAMIADRVVLLPGVELGEQTVMGSGALTSRGTSYADSTTWVGSKRGEAVCLNPAVQGSERSVRHKPSLVSYNSSMTTLAQLPASESSSMYDLRKYRSKNPDSLQVPSFTGESEPQSRSSSPGRPVSEKGLLQASANPISTPFGRAFYQGIAPYRVWSQSEIFLYSTIIAIATVIFWNVASISAVQVVARLFKDHNPVTTGFLAQNSWYRPLTIYILFLALILGIMAVQSIAVVGLLIGSKWALMGRRKQGNYDWDGSSYCQRWQLFLKLESFRRHCYGGNGILGMLTGTHWIVLYFRALGANIGQDCALFAGGLPSLMFTEPDLLTLGDRVSVDDASLVGHINTRGKFDLNELHVGDRSVLRSGSRLLSGARMEADGCLLEHTLVMAGDVVDAGSTNQGWPAENFTGSRLPTLQARQIWAKARGTSSLT